MKTFFNRVILGVAMFSFGFGAATVCVVLRARETHRAASEIGARMSGNTDIAPSEPSEEYFQVGEDERTLGIRHYVRPRSDYSGILGRLSEFVDLKARTKRNTFYICKIVRDDPPSNEHSNYTRTYVNVYWKEDNSILTLYPPYDREDNTYFDWTYSMRRIDLAKDVVPTRKDAGTTNYLFPKADVDSMLSECLGSGIKTVIEKS